MLVTEVCSVCENSLNCTLMCFPRCILYLNRKSVCVRVSSPDQPGLDFEGHEGNDF